MDEGQRTRRRNPRQDAGPLSVLTFAWLFETFRAGFRRELELADLYYPLDEHSSHHVGERIAGEWARERERRAATPSLARVLLRCFGRQILLAGIVQALLEFVVRLSRPYILLQLLHYSSERSRMAESEAYGWAAGLALGVFLDCVVGHLCVQGLMHTGMKIRVACSSLLYRKILRVPVTFTDSATSVGQVLNLLSNDVSRLDHAVFYMHYIWIAPLEALLVFYFLYREVGLVAGSGIALQLLFISILGLFGRLTNHLTIKYTARMDERLRLSNALEVPLNAHLYRLRRSKNEQGPGRVLLAICARGVRVYGDEKTPQVFTWNNVGKLGFDQRMRPLSLRAFTRYTAVCARRRAARVTARAPVTTTKSQFTACVREKSRNHRLKNETR